MDTEDEAAHMAAAQEAARAEIAALENLTSQLGDPEALHAAGAIDDDEYAERRAKVLAYTAAIASWHSGTEPDVPALIEQMREKVAEPSQTEVNTASIDYLMMSIGGEA